VEVVVVVEKEESNTAIDPFSLSLPSEAPLVLSSFRSKTVYRSYVKV